MGAIPTAADAGSDRLLPARVVVKTDTWLFNAWASAHAFFSLETSIHVHDSQRVTLIAKLGNSRIHLQVDVAFGDAVTPAAELVELPTLLTMPAPTLRAFPKETVLAEKFHAMVTLGMANSRMKDFFDLWILCRDFPFSGKALTQAIRATFQRRKTELPIEIPVALSDAFAADATKFTQWTAFVA